MTATGAATIVAVAPQTAPSAAAPPAPATKAGALTAELHLPQLGPGEKAPLLLMLHALGTSAEMIERLSEWPAFAEQNGLAWMAPNGPIDSQSRRFWDAGPSCCNFDGPALDHVSALSELLERTIAGAPIDRERVYVGGYSNGAFMAHRLACEKPELVRGVISIAGAGPMDRSSCKQPASLKVLQVHGDSDPIVTYEGGHLFKDPKLPRHISARQTAEDWAKALGCSSTTQPLEPVDFEASLSGPETKRERFRDCQRGGVELWTVKDGGHYIGFRNPGPSTIWEFFKG